MPPSRFSPIPSYLVFLVLTGIAILMSTNPAAAQARGSMFGTVVDDLSGEPLGGAEVFVEGTDIRAETDADGGFALPDLPVGDLTVRVVRPGYSTIIQQVEIRAIDIVDLSVRLTPMEALLRELLILGESESNSTGYAVAEVVPNGARHLTAADLLEGQVPGLNITSGGGNVGAGSNIQIRGISTITQSTAPSIYLDGIRISGGPIPSVSSGPSAMNILDQISADEVASIRILRGPAAGSRYPDSANGVIVIETVRGAPVAFEPPEG